MVKHEQIEWMGLKNCVRLYNGKAELIIPTEIGIRVMSYRLNNGKNIFKIFDEQIKNILKTEWQSFGGHRLWTAPESLPRTYEIDGVPLEKCEITNKGLELVQAVDRFSGIKKEVVIKLDADSPLVAVTHKITNMNAWPVKVAAWALSVLAEGGFCAIEIPRNETALLPDRYLSLWPYGRMNDKRVYWGDGIISLQQDKSAKTPFKFGALAAFGKAVYINGNTVFVKTFDNSAGEYPDSNCNFETYTNGEMIECESLSQLKLLNHGESIIHAETWSLFEIEKAVKFNDEKAVLQVLKVSL